MATSQPTTRAPPTEETFRNYTTGQSDAYAAARRDYNPAIYAAILQHHDTTGGGRALVVDCGCGPGIATRSLAPHFAQVIGLDASASMLTTARTLSESVATASGAAVRFEASTAEELGMPDAVSPGTVDMITAATAAHWFDMARFWPAAARALRPGGTVALWGANTMRAHPDMPNSKRIQEAIDAYTEGEIKEYAAEGNRVTKGGYKDLLLPWQLQEPVGEFDEKDFVRIEWDSLDKPFYKGSADVDLSMMEKMMGTGSALTRWREAHLEDVGTERDILRKLRREIERLLQEVGVPKGEERVKGWVTGTILLFKKKAA